MAARLAWCAGVLLSLAGTLYAQGSTTWISPNGGKWSDAPNWAGGLLPSAQVKAFFNGPSACVVDTADASAWQIDLAGGPLQIIKGGNLTVVDWFILGYQADDVGDNAGRLEVYDGGVLDCMVRLYVGYRAEGYLTIYEGGTVNIHTQLLGVGQQPGGNGSVQLEGGTLNLLDGTNAQGLNLTTPGAQANIDCRGGALVLRDTPENRAYLDQVIGEKIITAYGGFGRVVVDPNENRDKITVRGIHPLEPAPRDDGVAAVGQVELKWTPLDPCTPGAPVPVDAYFTDDLNLLQQFSDPAAIRVVTQKAVTSVVVPSRPKTRYYWAVDCYVGSEADPVLGPIFSFISDNLPPTVDAGADVVTWLQNGSRAGMLDATVTDDGGAASLILKWTLVSEPAAGTAIIETAGAEDTKITLLTAGRYVVQLEASDGEYSTSDTVTIDVYDDNCEAARSVPGYQPLVGDLNGDCRVDDLDLALLQENWLKDNSLTDDWLLLP
jgi:hypothetical protein